MRFGNLIRMKFRLLVKLDPETKRWSAVFPDLPATAGDTEEEAVQNAQEALELWFQPTPVKLDKGTRFSLINCVPAVSFPAAPFPA